MLTTQLLHGDCLKVLPTLPEASVHCCVTSPPYWGLRDYGTGADQLGLEAVPSCGRMETGLVELRRDLSPDEQRYVREELKKYGLSHLLAYFQKPEPCEACYVCRLVAVFREVRRVLRDDGTLWLVLGDSYSTQAGQGFIPGGGGQGQRWKRDLNKTWQPNRARIPGLRPKSLVGIPWRVALALQADGWILRSDIIWAKRNPMPESVRDRCTRSHEYVFMLAKQPRYYYDAEAVQEACGRAKTPGRNSREFVDRDPAHLRYRSGTKRRKFADGTDSRLNTHLGRNVPWVDEGRGRNRRDVWTLATQPLKAAHFAVFPPALVEPCILAGCPPGGTVLDPCGGAGTVALVAEQHGRHAVIIERNPDYIELTRARLGAVSEIPNRKATA